MKAVVIGESSGATMEQVMAVYPRHKALVNEFVARGEVIGIGPFTDRGNMAIFRTREAAEAFAKQDPFMLEGLVQGMVGGGLAIGFVFLARRWLDELLQRTEAVPLLQNFSISSGDVLLACLIVVITAVLLSVVSSALATRRFLDV